MVNDTEKFKDNDEKSRAHIEAKNQLESYAYSVRNTICDKKVVTRSQLLTRRRLRMQSRQ